MEKERKIKVLSLVALIVAVLGLTVAFAALSQTLTINGTASVDAAEWDIHFEEFKDDNPVIINGDGKLDGAPVIQGTTISNLNFELTKPGDSVVYVSIVKNDGDINAKLEDFSTPTLCTLSSPVESCDWDNDGTVTQSDIGKVNDNISFVIAKSGMGELIKKGDLLNSKDQMAVMVGLVYGKALYEGDYMGDVLEATELPKRDLVFKDISVTLNYVQAD